MEGESQGQGWLGETLQVRVPLSAHAFYRSCSELAESAQKQKGELSNVELLHKLRELGGGETDHDPFRPLLHLQVSLS